jgi:hypothetical protein
MAGNHLIVALAVVMLIYWFRYACALVLNARTEPECIARVAAAHGLSFLLVRWRLQRGEGRLDTLRRLLDRDDRLLRYLLRHTRGANTNFLELRLLRCHYLGLGLSYWCLRPVSSGLARRMLEERSRILTWLAHEVGRTLPADGNPARQDTIMSWHPKRRSSQRSTGSIKFAAK